MERVPLNVCKLNQLTLVFITFMSKSHQTMHKLSSFSFIFLEATCHVHLHCLFHPTLVVNKLAVVNIVTLVDLEHMVPVLLLVDLEELVQDFEVKNWYKFIISLSWSFSKMCVIPRFIYWFSPFI